MNEQLVETILGVLIATLSGLLGWVLAQVLKIRDQMVVLRRQQVELGNVEMPKHRPELWDPRRWGFAPDSERAHERREEVKVAVKFRHKFRDTPHVEVALAKVDLGDAVATVHRVELEAKNFSPEGFDLYFRTWKQSLLFDATATYVAAGEVPLSGSE